MAADPLGWIPIVGAFIGATVAFLHIWHSDFEQATSDPNEVAMIRAIMDARAELVAAGPWACGHCGGANLPSRDTCDYCGWAWEAGA